MWLIYSQVVIARRFYCTAWLVLCHKRLLSSSKAKKRKCCTTIMAPRSQGMDMCQLRHGFKKQLLQQQTASCTLSSFLHKLTLQNQKQRLVGANTNKTCLPSTVRFLCGLYIHKWSLQEGSTALPGWCCVTKDF